jgi:hypothetical protein
VPRQPVPQSLLTAARWPVGLAVTSWAYLWRTTVLHRRELSGSLPGDLPPDLPPGVELDDVLTPSDGAGPLLHRRYTSLIRDSRHDAHALMAALQADPNVVAPSALAHFHKDNGEEGRMAVGDEFLVRMPGPWDGPVRCVHVDATSFRFATLGGHLEAGQIEWRACDDDQPGRVRFTIESWARLGDRFSALLHDELRMAKEVQLHMWTSVHEQVARYCGGRLTGGIDIETRRVEMED